MVPTKQTTPHVPVSVQEVVEDVCQAYEVGITIAHLHARDRDGVATWQPEIYRDIFEGVRKHCPDLIVCGSSSGRNFKEFEKRSALLELRPDMCSLTLSSLNFVAQESVNSPAMVMRLAEKMNEYGVTPELECFDAGMVNYGLYLIKKGLVRGPQHYWNLLFGNIAGMQPTFSQIAAALSEIPQNHYIALAGLGDTNLLVHGMAIAAGLGVRVGIEDTIWFNRNKMEKATNLDLVKRVHEIMKIQQKSLLSSAEFGAQGFYNRTRL
jgi:3-keto-5-aminohexanoate cleavage enzyme